MNILFLYPKPVDSDSRRETRLEHQLGCISAIIRSLLSHAVVEQSISVREIVYETDNEHGILEEKCLPATEVYKGDDLQDFTINDLELVYQSSDLVIEVSGDKKTQTQFYGYKGASLTVRPTYPGSFAQNDVNIECVGIDEKSWITEKIIEATRTEEARIKIDEYVDPDMFYSQFSPLPYRLGKEFYSRPREHALVFLSFTAGEDDEQVCDKDQETISLLLHDMEALSSLTIVTDTLKTAPRVERIAASLRQALGIDCRVFAHRRGDYRDLFSVLSKCDMALFAGSSLYVDAIRLGIPSYVWRSPQEGVAPLNEAFLTLSETYDLASVLQQQRDHLEQLVQSHYLAHTLPNNSRVLVETMSEVIEKIASGVVIDTDKLISDSAIPQPIIDQPRVWHDDSVTRRVKNSLSISRKKLSKLRQNPERFLKESTNPFAQKIYTLVR